MFLKIISYIIIIGEKRILWNNTEDARIRLGTRRQNPNQGCHCSDQGKTAFHGPYHQWRVPCLQLLPYYRPEP